MVKMSPMMEQYKRIKEEHKEHILFFRLGDFYEMFFEDAVLCSKELDLTLTGKDCGQEERAPMCGVPYHSCEAYIARLIKKGYKVAICEQTEKPQKNKSLVERKVIRIITPGTVIENNILDDDKNNYIASIYYSNGNVTISFCDISTGIINLTNTPLSQFEVEASRFMPKEVLVDKNIISNNQITSFLKDKINAIITQFDFDKNDDDYYKNVISEHLNNTETKFDIDNYNVYLKSLGGLICYLRYTQKTNINRVNQIKFYDNNDYMNLSYNTRVNLELLENARNKEKKGSLFWVLDNTNTPMGKRLLRSFISKPLIDVDDINKRLEATSEIINDYSCRENIIDILKNVYDIERVLTRIMYKNVSPRELLLLKGSISQIDNLKANIKGFKSHILSDIYNNTDELYDISGLIENSIKDEPPATIKDGGYIRDCFNEEIDRLRYIIKNSKQMLVDLGEKIKENTGIKTLKISYNKVFGYYFEVTKLNQHLVPDYFVRRQTLSNCERYVTDELKKLEEEILSANDKILQLERNLYDDILDKISMECNRIQNTTDNIAFLDVLTSFATISFNNRYIKPEVTENEDIVITDGRHPVVEKLTDDIFVPNNTNINTTDNMINIITGPNMAGKSTYMRQVAIITIMAQIGCFVPANYAKISVVDKVFTRVGAYDDLSSGMSTFMVEMSEVSEILQCATKNSLLILDEIGRGTSTYDGMSIAMSVIEYIGSHICAKTLFSTHYHELTEMEHMYPYIKNYNVLVKKTGNTINFLRRIVQGAAYDSYGIDVAELAGVPQLVVERANEVLKQLENGSHSFINTNPTNKIEKKDVYNDNNEVIDMLKNIDVETLTPIEAMLTLSKIINNIK